jgi:hypothetical protein
MAQAVALFLPDVRQVDRPAGRVVLTSADRPQVGPFQGLATLGRGLFSHPSIVCNTIKRGVRVCILTARVSRGLTGPTLGNIILTTTTTTTT